MMLAKVIGTVVASARRQNRGLKMLILQPLDLTGVAKAHTWWRSMRWAR
jgi:microcompartment protein CcmK/EutM